MGSQMFGSVLPPPPRYAQGAQGAAAQLIETNNTIAHPTGPEHQLVVGEGTKSAHQIRPQPGHVLTMLYQVHTPSETSSI